MKQDVEGLRNKYPAGTRVRLMSMDDPYAVPAGTTGTVKYIDDIGTVHVSWDNGSGLGLIPGEDSWEVISNGQHS